jgi:hypothetical protein
VSQSQIVIVTCYVCRRKSSRRSGHDSQTTYQLWIVIEVRPATPEITDPDLVLQRIRNADATRGLNARLREAAAETAADHVNRAIWGVWKTSDNLSLAQAIDFLGGASDDLHRVIQDSLTQLNRVADVPAPVSLVGADVAATLLTKPIAQPIDELTHGLEVAGIFLGLVTGLHPLVMTCAKYLIHDATGNVLDSAFQKLEEASLATAAHNRTTAADCPAESHETPDQPTRADRPVESQSGAQVQSDDARERLDKALQAANPGYQAVHRGKGPVKGQDAVKRPGGIGSAVGT